MTARQFESTFDAAREAFDRIDSLRLHNETSEYEFTRGRAQYLTFLVRIEDAATQRHVTGMQEHLDGISGIELYPEPYWHMSVKGVGFQVIKRALPDDVLREEVPRIINDARMLLKGQAAFEARLGAVAGFPEVIFIEVHDGGRIRELNALLGEGLPQLHRAPFDGAKFLPHVSIARFTSNDGLPQLKQTIATRRDDAASPTVHIRRIELVKVWLSEEMPEFQTLATYNLS